MALITGSWLNQAKQALIQAIEMLCDIDFFNIIQYDHEQVYWQQAPVSADKAAKAQAQQWVGQIQARGLTDILTPLQSALQTLEGTPVNTSAGMSIPFIFLMTDGAVDNEREICHFLSSQQRRTRIMTMGIGE